MSPFKVGDRVKRLRHICCTDNLPHTGGNDGFYPDDTGMIFDIDEDGIDVKMDKNGAISKGSSDEFLQLIEETNKSLDITAEGLVQKLNEGLKARQTLYQMPGVFLECKRKYHQDAWESDGGAAQLFEYRIKPKPKFEQWTTSNGWAVRLDGGLVKVGCQALPAKLLGNLLGDLLIDCAFATGYEENFKIELVATKTGVRYENHILPWADAEKLYKMLREVQ